MLVLVWVPAVDHAGLAKAYAQSPRDISNRKRSVDPLEVWNAFRHPFWRADARQGNPHLRAAPMLDVCGSLAASVVVTPASLLRRFGGVPLAGLARADRTCEFEFAPNG